LRKDAEPAAASSDVDHVAAAGKDWAANAGFDVHSTTRALEESKFSFPDALVLLLNGNDPRRNSFCANSRFRRHTARKKVRSVNLQERGSLAVREQYEHRAQADLRMHLGAIDLGQHAGGTTGACFWLCLAAGLSRANWHLDTQALPGLADASALFQEVRTMQARTLDQARPGDIQHTPLGQFAEKLRLFMCAGPDAVLLRGDVKQTLYPALQPLGEPTFEK